MQDIIVMEGPDGCGKTEIGKALAKVLMIPYFKVSSEKENFQKGRFKEALEFDQTYIAEFLKQTRCSVVIDRAWPSEWVYSKVFKRETNPGVLSDVDDLFAAMGTIVIVCLRRDYSKNREDEIIPREKFQDLHDMYENFCAWTNCRTIKIYVDDFADDTNIQVNKLVPEIEYMSSERSRRHTEISAVPKTFHWTVTDGDVTRRPAWQAFCSSPSYPFARR